MSDHKFNGETMFASAESKGTYPLLNNVNEQDVVVLSPTKRYVIWGVLLDLVNITQTGVIRFYSMIDGVNYREIDAMPYDSAVDSDGVFWDQTVGATDPFKVTYQSNVLEGAPRNIPYSIVYGLAEQ